LIGGLAASAVGLRLYALLPEGIKWQANLIIGVGLIVFVLGAALLNGLEIPEKLKSRLSRAGEAMKVSPAQAVYLLLALLFSFSASQAAGTGAFMRSKPLGFGCWLVAFGLLVIGGWDSDETLPKPSLKTILIALSFFIISTAIRAIAIGDIPPLLNGDEASSGLSAVDFFEGHTDNIFGVGWFSFPSLYFYLQSYFIWIFGQTTFAIRFPSAIIGGLTVMAAYLVGKRMISNRAGLIAGIFLAGSHFHNHFSRLALNNIYDALWFLLALGFLWDGWKHQRRSSFLVAGISFGLAQYFYASSRFLVGIIPIWVLMAIIIQRKRLIGNRSNLLILLIAFVVVVLPLGVYYLENPADFMAPFNRVESLGDWLSNETVIQNAPAWKIIKDQLIFSAKTFISKPSEVWYRPKVPILQPFAAGVFIAGLLLMLFQLRRPRTYLLLFWVGSFILIGGLSVPVSAAQRYVAALPAVALIIGFALDECGNLLEKVWQQKRTLLSVSILIVTVLISLNDLYFYLYTYTPVSDLGGLNTLVAQRLADYLQDKEDLQVAFFGEPRMGYYSINTTAYLAPHIEGLDFNQPWGSQENPVLTSDHILFIFLPGNEGEMESVKQTYPHGSTAFQQNTDGSVLFWLYTIYLPNYR
jgi:4-amino-4-deoxy-L-arabinose transferase-like glycosyltransferase